jgi:hypothetical protein
MRMHICETGWATPVARRGEVAQLDVDSSWVGRLDKDEDRYLQDDRVCVGAERLDAEELRPTPRYRPMVAGELATRPGRSTRHQAWSPAC